MESAALRLRETVIRNEVTARSLSVLVDAAFGPDIVTRGVAGDTATVPSAVVVALFAFLGTWVVAKYGFRHGRSE